MGIQLENKNYLKYKKYLKKARFLAFFVYLLYLFIASINKSLPIES